MMYLVTMQPEIMYGVTDIEKIRLRDTCAEIEKVALPYTQGKAPNTFTIIKQVFLCCCRGIFFFIMGLLSPVYIIIQPLRASKKHKPEPHTEEKPSGSHLAFRAIIRGVNTEVDPVCIKGYRSRSVLFNGSRLAKELENLGDRKWEIMSKDWVEMLTYAAVKCRPRTLAEQLSRGGELLSFVWLLMAHFGFVHNSDFLGAKRRAELVVEE